MVDYQEQREYWDSRSKRRSPSHPAVQAFALPKIELLRQRLTLLTEDKPSLLEIGAGNGYFSVVLDEYFSLTCTDFSENMLQMNPVAEEQKQTCDAEDIPFDDNSFDVVFCANLLHHLEDPRLAVNEMKRVAKHYVCLIEPNILNPAMFLFGLLKKEEHGSLKFTPSYMRRLLKASGLEVDTLLQHGSIVPNKTPSGLLPFLNYVNVPFLFGLYHIAVCRV